jgi:hypothetical protein
MAFIPVVLLAFVLAGSQLAITGVLSEGISKTDCNATKGCFFQPANCDPMHDCSYAITYRPTQNGSVAFELSAMITPDQTALADYVAVGFSHDREMGKDAVTQCIIDKSGKAKVSLSYNSGKSNTPIADGQKLDEEMIAQVSGSSESVAGKTLLTCRFEQKLKSQLDDGSHVYDLSSTPLYLLLAAGRADPASKSIAKHTTNHENPQFPAISPVQLNLVKVGGSQSPPQPEQNGHADNNHSQNAIGSTAIPEPENFAKTNGTGKSPLSEPEHTGNSVGGAHPHLQEKPVEQNHNNSAYSLVASSTAVVFATILHQIL